MSNKPKWVEALESAEGVLRKADDATPEEQHALNLIAHAWITVATVYQQQPAA